MGQGSNYDTAQLFAISHTAHTQGYKFETIWSKLA